MSRDIKIFKACNHIVNNVQYQSQFCPRCYSKGYYFDIAFDMKGQIITTTGGLKLQQEMLKVLIDQKEENVFHPGWGSEIEKIIGHKNVAITKTRLEVIIRKSLEYLKAVQVNEYKNNENLTINEILEKIIYIEINALGPTGWHVNVIISNQQGEIYEETITF